MRSQRTRTVASVVLAVLAAGLLIVGAIAFYARTQVIEQRSFADRAVAALDRDEVRYVVGREIVTAAVDSGSTDLVEARPLLESVVDAVMRSEPFRDLVRRAAVEADRVFFDRSANTLTLNLADAGRLVRFAARAVSPRLARQIPSDLEPDLLRLQRREFAASTLAAADRIRTLAIVLPLVALLALVGAVAVAPDRRVGVLRAGIAIASAGVLLAAALLVLRWRIVTNVFGEDELTNADVRGAVGGLLDSYFGDLFAWSLGLAVAGVVVAGAAASLDPVRVQAPAQRLRRVLLARPQATWLRAARGAAMIVLGVFIVLEPTLALELAALLAGAYLVFLGVAELLVLLQGPAPAADAPQRRRHTLRVASAVSGIAIAAVIGAIVLYTSNGAAPPSERAAATTAETCNGTHANCSLRLNQAVFAGTHNSFSAADSAGWTIANQRHTIQRQLQDGIRLFLIDPHWGVERGGHVFTDFRREGRDRNHVAKALPPVELAAAQRLVRRNALGTSADPGKDAGADVWLCHSVCELGATKMADALGDIAAFLERNRGEVVILFIEPYVTPATIARVFHQAGLDRYVATLQRDAPLPTLGELVRSDKRVIVFTEQDADGSVPWYLDGFSFVQDTPLGTTKVSQLSCRRNRGTADSPLLMLNHWADVFPPSVTKNVPFQTRAAILRRARQCARVRGQPVNLIAVDHYDQGDLIGAVRTLNARRATN